MLLASGAVLDDDHGRIKPAYQLDFLHLVPAGYEALDEELLSVVRGLPSRTSAAP